jgi:predicted enzyme related to lactoylglutathione lyase
MAAQIVHIEFRSRDFDRTAAFYAKLFDWQTQQNATASYMKLDSGDGPSGGWIRADLVQAPGPVPYLVVDDLIEKLAEVEGAGGRVLVRSMPFAGGGEVGLFADPDGNVVGLWMRKKGDKGDKPDKAADKGGSAESAAAKKAAAAAVAKPTSTTAAKRPAKPAAKTAKKK